jgi:hypothetical protein
VVSSRLQSTYSWKLENGVIVPNLSALYVSAGLYFSNAHINLIPITIPATWWIGFFSWLYDNNRYSIRQYSEFIKLIFPCTKAAVLYHQCYLSILLILQYLFSWVLFYCNCNIAQLPTLGLILQFKCVRVIKSLTWRTHFFFCQLGFWRGKHQRAGCGVIKLRNNAAS